MDCWNQENFTTKLKVTKGITADFFFQIPIGKCSKLHWFKM